MTPFHRPEASNANAKSFTSGLSPFEPPNRRHELQTNPMMDYKSNNPHPPQPTTETFQKQYGRIPKSATDHSRQQQRSPSVLSDGHRLYRGERDTGSGRPVHPPEGPPYPPDGRHYAGYPPVPPAGPPPPHPAHNSHPPSQYPSQHSYPSNPPQAFGPPPPGYSSSGYGPPWYFPPQNRYGGPPPAEFSASYPTQQPRKKEDIPEVDKPKDIPVTNPVTPKSEMGQVITPNSDTCERPKSETTPHLTPKSEERQDQEIFEPKVDPMKQDFHFYVMDHADTAREKAKQQIVDNFPDADKTEDTHLLMTLLNSRLMHMWEQETPAVRALYLKKEEGDRRRFMNDDEIASRHCATLTARTRSPKYVSSSASFGLSASHQDDARPERTDRETNATARDSIIKNQDDIVINVKKEATAMETPPRSTEGKSGSDVSSTKRPHEGKEVTPTETIDENPTKRGRVESV